MMDHVLGHLVRRGIDAHASFRAAGEASPEEPAYQMPTWGLVLLTATSIIFVVALSMIEYTYAHLIATLSMVESPTAAIFEPLGNDDPYATLDKKSATPVEPELYVVKQAPITSKLSTAIRYLRDRAGFWSRFRGLSIWLVYHFLFARLSQLFGAFDIIPMGFGGILAAVILARLRMGWTHIVISEPSTKYWFQRLPSWGSWKKIAMPTFVLAVCEQITLGLPVALWITFRLSRLNNPQEVADMSDSERKLLLLKAFSVVFLGLFSAIAIVVPANVSLTRIQASLLPDEVETIIPFDRSFAGKAVPAVAGGSSVIGMLEAWKTFDWNARVRLLKLYAKVIAMQLAVYILFILVIVGQLHLIMGDELRKGASWMKGYVNH